MLSLYIFFGGASLSVPSVVAWAVRAPPMVTFRWAWGTYSAQALVGVLDLHRLLGELVGTEASHHSGNASHDVSVRVNFSVAPFRSLLEKLRTL